MAAGSICLIEQEPNDVVQLTVVQLTWGPKSLK